MMSGHGDYRRDYWRDRLGAAPAELAWPHRQPRPSWHRPSTTLHRALPDPLVAGVHALAAGAGTDATTVLLALLRVLLVRHTGENDLLLGLVVPGRGADLTVLRHDLGGDPTVRMAIAAEARARASEAAHPLPFEAVVDAVRPASRPGTFPLAQVVLVDGTGYRPPACHGLSMAAVAGGADPYPFDLTVTVTWGAQPALRWAGRARVVDAADCAALAERFEVLLGAAVTHPDRPVPDLDLCTAADRRAMTGAGRAVAAPPALPALVDTWVLDTPDVVAVRHGEDTRTYRDLDTVSRRIAGRLAAAGLAAEAAVGVLVERTVELPAIILGVLRAGYACVPLDPAHPADRRAYILADSGAAALITDQPAGAGQPAGGPAAFAGRPALSVAALVDPAPGPEAAYRDPPLHPDQIAYVLYTSGSTGRPKGVAVTHRGLANCLCATRDLMAVRPGQRLLAVTTISFDIAMLELFLTLTAGGQTVVATTHEARNGHALMAALSRWRPHFTQATPLTWQMLFYCGWPGDPDLVVSCGGDVVSPALAARLRACCKGVWHTYGPTEASLYAVCTPLQAGPQPDPVPIGTPLPGVWVRILDERQRPVPPGVVGELCLGGSGVARGYVGQPALTADRFVPDPYLAGRRVYRTGDLARQLPDGRFELHGRNDRQLKIRGHRIEPAEIEAVLAEHPDVAYAAVVATGPRDEARLTAFLELAGAAAARPAVMSVARHARGRLSHAMTPSLYGVVARMPVGATGKVDRGVLGRLRPPAPAASRTSHADHADPVRAAVSDLWVRVTGAAAGEDLLAPGGDVAAARFTAEVNRAFGVTLPVAMLYHAPTLAGYAERVRRAVFAAGAGRRPVVRWRQETGDRAAAVLFTVAREGFDVTVTREGFDVERLSAAVEADRPVGVVDVGATGASGIDVIAAELAGLGYPSCPVLVGTGAGAPWALAVARRLRTGVGMTVPVVAVDPAPIAGDLAEDLAEDLAGTDGGPVYCVTGTGGAAPATWQRLGRRLSVIALPLSGPPDDAAARLAGVVAGVA